VGTSDCRGQLAFGDVLNLFVNRQNDVRALIALGLSAVKPALARIRHDQDLQSWAREFLHYLKHNLENTEQVNEKELAEQKQDLKQRWKELIDKDSDKGRQWKNDVSQLHSQLRSYEEQVNHDPQLQAIKRAHAKFSEELQQCLVSSEVSGAQLAMNQASWLWQDFFNVYLPRILGLVKSMPIPRFVLSNPLLLLSDIFPGRSTQIQSLSSSLRISIYHRSPSCLGTSSCAILRISKFQRPSTMLHRLQLGLSLTYISKLYSLLFERSRFISTTKPLR